MRVFSDFNEARNEMARDLNELGVEVFAGYQSLAVSEEQRAALTTKELENYGYKVIMPMLADLQPTQPWADAEWADRHDGIMGHARNPGNAWSLRSSVWEHLLEPPKREGGVRHFSYTYSERLDNAKVPHLIEAFQANPNSRQIYISIWDAILDGPNVGHRRVPCSLGYQLMIRNGHLDMTYHMRSSDFATHWENDVWLALKLRRFVAEVMGVVEGQFTHVLGSLHVYAKEVAGVF